MAQRTEARQPRREYVEWTAKASLHLVNSVTPILFVGWELWRRYENLSQLFAVSGTILVSLIAALVAGAFSLRIVSAVRKLSGTVRVFVSYPHELRTVAVQLAERLRAKNFHVWLDVDRIRPGDSIQRSIEQGIANSDVFVFISPSLMTDGIHNELELALKRGLRVIPVVATEVTAMPPELAGISHVNLLTEKNGLQRVVDA